MKSLAIFFLMGLAVAATGCLPVVSDQPLCLKNGHTSHWPGLSGPTAIVLGGMGIVKLDFNPNNKATLSVFFEKHPQRNYVVDYETCKSTRNDLYVDLKVNSILHKPTPYYWSWKVNPTAKYSKSEKTGKFVKYYEMRRFSFGNKGHLPELQANFKKTFPSVRIDPFDLLNDKHSAIIVLTGVTPMAYRFINEKLGSKDPYEEWIVDDAIFSWHDLITHFDTQKKQ